MVEIKKGVGDGGVNASEDVALVQLMLRVIKDAKGQPYLSTDYNGNYDPTIKAAIIAFQKDQKLIADDPPAGAKPGGPPPPVGGAAAAPKPGAPPVAAAKAPPPGPPAAAAAKGEKPGLLAPGSKTFDALVAKLPAEYKEIRIMPGTKTIYLAGDQAKATAMATKLRNEKELNVDFREKVAQLVETMYKDHKLQLGIPADGWRRNFKAQANVNPAATGAGPGESPHQFGRAVDIGFFDFKWVAGNGQIKTDSPWIDNQGLTSAKQVELWNARNDIAFKKLGLFKTNKAGDLIHVQGFDDAKVSWGKSLAKLLETVSPVKAKWSVVGGSPNTYKADVGLGQPLTAGSANQLWSGTSPISKTELVAALNAKLAADPAFSVEKFFGVVAKPAPPPPAADPKAAAAAGGKPVPPAAPAAPAKPTPLKEADIKAEYITYLQKLLKVEIETADKSWDQWAPTK